MSLASEAKEESSLRRERGKICIGLCRGLMINKNMLRWIAILLMGGCMMNSDAQPKGFNYDESQVPDYDLPDSLVNKEGKAIDAATWQSTRRDEILHLFQTQIYGQQPPAPSELEWERYEESSEAIGGKATRQQIRLFPGGRDASVVFDLLVYLPNRPLSKGEKVPAFVGLNFMGNHTVQADPAITLNPGWIPRRGKGVVNNQATDASRGTYSHRWPVEQIIDRGFAVATIYTGDIDPDEDDQFQNGIHALYPELQGKGDNFSSISAWAWGLSRAMDYFERADEVDSQRVAVIGHSRLGKTALWAGATDSRFAMVVSNNSGCGGAALSRRRFGETVAKIGSTFPHWFCQNFTKYHDKEDSLPVDQHQLIELVAPRLVYIASASEDRWADPRGEFLSAQHASPVYRLLGKRGIAKDAEWPDPGQVIHTDSVGYHLREGKHDILAEDWQHYLDFAEERMR
ncbi:MAG: acetylxylan esterase [Verrucomicrobiota bacterium]